MTVKFNAIEAAVGRPRSPPESGCRDGATTKRHSAADTAPPIGIQPTDLPKVGRVDTQSPPERGSICQPAGFAGRSGAAYVNATRLHKAASDFGVSLSKEVERQIRNPADFPRSSAPALAARNSETVEQSTGQEPGSPLFAAKLRGETTCSLGGRWECVGCRNSYADVRELSGGPDEFEMTENKTTTHGIFDVLEGKITLSDLQYDNQYITVGGIVGHDCKSVNWDFKHWAWSC